MTGDTVAAPELVEPVDPPASQDLREEAGVSDEAGVSEKAGVSEEDSVSEEAGAPAPIEPPGLPDGDVLLEPAADGEGPSASEGELAGSKPKKSGKRDKTDKAPKSDKPSKAPKASKAPKPDKDAARRATAEKGLKRATRKWRTAKKREREARNALAALVQESVAAGLLTENRIATLTDTPRMTIRKMLGKDV